MSKYIIYNKDDALVKFVSCGDDK